MYSVIEEWGGRLLIGDIHNASKKKRFLSSETGRDFHMKWSSSQTCPNVCWNKLEPLCIDDSVIFSILQRYRSMGCESYLLEQLSGLPMNNTREDILIVKQ